ncbi:MAG: precorrin-2 methylase, partial [Planctomycetota bacterium]
SHWQDNDLFGSIHWDPYRKLIYRIMEEPNVNYNKDMLRDPLERARNMVVMAFDTKQDYRKVAEMRLKKSEKGVYLDRCFVNEKGFNITYVDLENEDKLYFKTFLVE